MLYKRTYSNCDNLPLYNFIKTLTTNDLDYLIIPKSIGLKPNLALVWENIFTDYSDRMEDKQSRKVFLMMKEIKSLENAINLSNNCIQLLLKVNNLDKFKPTIEALKSTLQVYAQFTNETIAKDLKTCMSKIKMLRSKHSQLIKEYNSMVDNSDRKATEKDFIDQIVILEESMGVPIDPKNISTAKYISYINRLREKVKDGH